MAQLVKPVQNTDIYTVKLYTQPFTWSSEHELDVTSEVASKFVLTEKINSYHTAEITLKEGKYKFNDTTSEYYMFRGMRFKITYNGRDYKMIVRSINPDIKNGVVSVSLSSHSYDLYNPPFAQIRVQNSLDGNYYIEDVIWRALYDTGQQNFFVIKLQDGSYFTPSFSPDNKIQMEANDDVVYTRVPVINIINDLCAKTGCIWYESDYPDNDMLSVINIVSVESDYDAPEDKIVYISAYDQAFDIRPTKDFDTLSNTIYFDNLPFYVQENESIDRYGSRSGKVIKFPDDGDMEKYNRLMFSMRSVLRDPEVSIPISCRRLLNIPSLDSFVKIVDDEENYSTDIGIDRKYRINEIKYDFMRNATFLDIGNRYRKIWLEKLEDLAKGVEDNKDSNERQLFGYQDELRIQVHTDTDDLDSSLTETSTGFGVRLDVDCPYDATYSTKSKFYMSDDGVRTGN